MEETQAAAEAAEVEEENDEPNTDCGGYLISSPSGYVQVHLCGDATEPEVWPQVKEDILKLIEILQESISD